VRNSLRALEGVRQVEVNIDEETAVVVYVSNVIQTADLIQATTNIGFPSTIKQPDQR
jgi:copper chaperone CopZ